MIANKFKLILYIYTSIILCAAMSFGANRYVEEFGVTEGTSVNKGFVFLDGQYIEAPYIVSRRGLKLFVNDREIKCPSRHPGGKPYTGNIDISRLTTEKRQKLFRALEATRGIYEKYLSRDYCYLFFNSGGHKRLETYTAAYTLPLIIELLKSNEPREKKLQELIRRNWHLSGNIELLVDNFSTSSQLMTRLEQKAQELLRVDEFGETAEEDKKLVDKGFVFLDGKYVDAPYIVTRKGLGIFLNGKMIEQPCKWPVNIPSGDEDPTLPPEINTETSMNDEVANNYLLAKHAYLRKNHTREEERRIMEKVFRGLPFITEAKLDKNKPHILHITTTEGFTINQSLVSMRGRRVVHDKNTILQRVEKSRKHFCKMLKRNDCYFLSSAKGYRTHLSLPSVKAKLPQMNKILQSPKSSVEKSKQIRQFCGGISDRLLDELINNFSASPQLEKRLNKLIGQGKVNQKTKRK